MEYKVGKVFFETLKYEISSVLLILILMLY